MNRRYSEATLSLIRMKSEFNAKSYNSKHSKKIGDQNYEEKGHDKQRIDAGWQSAHIWCDCLHEARKLVTRSSNSNEKRSNTLPQFIQRQKMRHSVQLWKMLKFCETMFTQRPTAYNNFMSLANRMPVV
ncbi:MAG: hypothetical protein II623_03930, partial [Paludibacteraceae bacterium]|nr:hypothetical protein [Paludibacteraceae bacterium]